MTAALTTHDLVKNFGGLVATDHVSLSIAKGARHALIGPNGAGKTTLINLLTGVLQPTSGRIQLMGEDVTAISQHSRVKRGLVRTFQINQLFADLTPLQSLGLAISERHGQGIDWWRVAGTDQRYGIGFQLCGPHHRTGQWRHLNRRQRRRDCHRRSRAHGLSGRRCP